MTGSEPPRHLLSLKVISLSVCPEKHSTWGTCVLLLPHKLTVGRDLQQAPEVTRYVVTGSFGAAASFCLILLDLHRILFTQGQLSSQTAWVHRPAPLLISWVTLGKWLNLPKLQSSHL